MRAHKISRRAKLARSLTAMAAVAVSLVLGVAGPAAAMPTISTFPIDESEVDPGASAACGFTVTTTIVGTGRLHVFVDQSGNPTRSQFKVDLSGTFSGNGLTVNQAAHSVSFFDLTQGTHTEIGLLDRIFASNGTLQIEVGRLVFDANGNVTFEAGPHPALHGDFTALCAALTP